MHMAAEHDLHTPFNPPAAESRAAETNVETHVLDLTTVCVKSGAVLLPRALIGLFTEEGVVAQSDGGELRLEFKAPRTLAGLTEFFELHGLRANDRLLFVFEDGALHLSVRKRERNDPAAPRRAAGKRAAAGAAEGTPGPSSQGRAAAKPSDWQLAVEKQEAQVIAERRADAQNQKGISVDRFSGPVGELVPQAPRRREQAAPGKADAQRDAQRRAPEQRDAYEQRVGSAQRAADAQRGTDSRSERVAVQPEEAVRSVVTRVRLEGGVPAGTGGAARPKELASAHDVWARRQHARWQPLDAVIAARHDPRTFDADFPDTVVRAFRRGPNGSLRPEPELLPTEPAAPAKGSRAARSNVRHARVDSAPALGAPRTTSRRAAPTNEAPTTETAFQALAAGSGDGPHFDERYPDERSLTEHEAMGLGRGAGERRAAARAGVAPCAGEDLDVEQDPPLVAPADRTAFRSVALESVGDQHADQHADQRGDEDLAEEAPAKGQRKGVIARLSGLRLSLGRERGHSGWGAHDGVSGPSGFQGPLQAPPKAYPLGQRGGPASGNAPAARASGAVGDRPAERPARVSTPSEGAYGLQQGGSEPAAERRAHQSARLAVLEDALLDADVSVKPSVRRGLPEVDGPKAPPVGAPVEEDMAFIEAYLLRPGTPAIVRSIDLAERIGMSPERAARAMERLSEQRERFSRIRDGAYMVRQVR